MSSQSFVTGIDVLSDIIWRAIVQLRIGVIPLSDHPIAFEDRIFSVNETLRDHVPVSRASFYKQVREKKIDVVKIGRRTFVTGRAIKKARGEAV